MPDYFAPGMRLYLERMVDWEELLTLQRGDGVDVDSEVGAYRTILETTAALAQSFEADARTKWAAKAELTPEGGARPPAHIREAYARLRENGLMSLQVSEKYGGYRLPALLNSMVLEMISRADTSLMTVIGLQTGVADDIERYGSADVKQAFLPGFVSGELQGCMDLTEPQAGSDLGGIATRATELPDGRIRVDGQKIFITNGGADIHLVLARDDDTFDESRTTTNGLSLVLVPREADDGSPNGVRVTRLENKLGIHGSPTCAVSFEGAVGVRLGEKGKGFRAMLDLMNHARLGVAAQALGLCEAAFHEAITHAYQREQFGHPIVDEPLVKSMLSKMAVNIEAVRALLFRALTLVDHTAALEAALARDDVSDAQRAAFEDQQTRDTTRIRLLTPLCKYFATEICDDLTRDAMQVLGGIGYTMESDVAKLHADSLIMTIYEGTSEIQASFALREMGKGALGTVASEVRRELASVKTQPGLEPLAERVETALTGIEKVAASLFDDIKSALLRAKLMAEMVINVIAASELLRQAAADPDRLDLAEAFIRRRMLETENMGKRIEQNTPGHLERDGRILSRLAPR